MSIAEALKLFADIVLSDENKMLGFEEINDLLVNAKTDEERDLYVCVYNHLLQQRQKEVMRNEKY
jgi:precorrin-3B methylase